MADSAPLEPTPGASADDTSADAAPVCTGPALAAPADPWIDVSADDRDEGWGERSTGYSDDWYLRGRPPHHG